MVKGFFYGILVLNGVYGCDWGKEEVVFKEILVKMVEYFIWYVDVGMMEVVDDVFWVLVENYFDEEWS